MLQDRTVREKVSSREAGDSAADSKFVFQHFVTADYYYIQGSYSRTIKV